VAAPQQGTARALALRRGFVSGLVAIALLAVAALPSRLAVAARSWGSIETKVERVLCGALIDVSAVVLVLAPAVFALACLFPLVMRRFVGPKWQGAGPLVSAVPPGFTL
jgi:ABC-type anion transport system duplicated permease subunit